MKPCLACGMAVLMASAPWRGGAARNGSGPATHKPPAQYELGLTR